jgi:AbrB family looped-hinge helix DNA binding protein
LFENSEQLYLTDVLKVSSKGQVVLPAEMRKRLSISSGDKLAAYASGDVIMLKVIKLPNESEFKTMLNEAQDWTASVGYKQGDVDTIIKSVRKKRRK